MLRYSGSGWSPLQDRRYFVQAQEAWGPCNVARTMLWHTALRGNILQPSAPCPLQQNLLKRRLLTAALRLAQESDACSRQLACKQMGTLPCRASGSSLSGSSLQPALLSLHRSARHGQTPQGCHWCTTHFVSDSCLPRCGPASTGCWLGLCVWSLVTRCRKRTIWGTNLCTYSGVTFSSACTCSGQLRELDCSGIYQRSRLVPCQICQERMCGQLTCGCKNWCKACCTLWC